MNPEKPKVSAEDIEHLIEIFKQSGWDEMHLEAAGLEMFLSNDPSATGPRGRSGVAERADVAATLPMTASAAPSAAVVPQATIPEGLVVIRAPNLGTFYRAPKPGAPAYVEIGQQIEPATEVCLIEVMKLFTPVPSGVRGIVREIRAHDGQMVEFDELLFLVEPN